MGDTTRKSVWYRGRWYGNIDITIDNADQTKGTAIIDGKTRQIVYRPYPKGVGHKSQTGTHGWICSD